MGGTATTMDCGQALYFSLPLVSRFALVSRSARNIAFAYLAKKCLSCRLAILAILFVISPLMITQVSQLDFSALLIHFPDK